MNEKQKRSNEELSIYANEKMMRFREEANLKENADVIRNVFKLITNDGTSKASDEKEHYEMDVKTLDYLVRNVLGLEPEELMSLWSTPFNKSCKIENIARRIAKTTPPEIQNECFYDVKRIVFRVCWPEVYEKAFPKIEFYDIFDAKGDLKAHLSKAGKFQPGEGKVSMGEAVDKIIMDAMIKAFETALEGASVAEFYEETFKMLASTSYYKSFTQEGRAPGSYQVIESRGCYDNPLDFFFLNLPPEEQMDNFELFMKVRRDFNMPPNRMLDAFYETFESFEKEGLPIMA